MVAEWIRQGMPKDQIVVNAGKAEKDWDYVWGATGQRCTVAQRKAFISRQRAKGYEGEAQETIKKCQVLNGSAGSCAGCKFYCDGKGTLIHDCQGFVKEICSRVGITLSGGGSNSMWNNNANWTKKGSIKDMPEQVCCIFWTGKNKDGKIVKSHIGFYIGGGMMVHCSGCVKVEKLSKKATDYALIAGLEGDVPVPHKTIKKGSTGPDVVLCQEDLIQLGYDLSPYGADGKFGAKTETAVKAFQTSVGLLADGIVGKKTWAALDEAVKPGPEPEPPAQLYTVIIPHLTEEQTNALQEQYPDAEKRKEG